MTTRLTAFWGYSLVLLACGYGTALEYTGVDALSDQAFEPSPYRLRPGQA